MGQHPQASTSDVDNAWDILESQIRECYGRVVYTHKVHEKNADLYLARLRRTKILQILLSAITTGGILGVLFSSGAKVLEVITAATATTQFFLNTYIKEYSLSDTAERHSVTASKLWSIRESYLSLLADLISRQTTLDDARKIREELQQELVAIYEKAPRTISKAYKEAQKALKLNEELTFSDEEIDLFLPKPLKKKNR
ncbi:hypothetical protein C7271_04665 [filamentous cyanobacterium CCP5]|nr:hypothetical protein C7271_04665 [filamentous cyanobacterium CCP5]